MGRRPYPPSNNLFDAASAKGEKDAEADIISPSYCFLAPFVNLLLLWEYPLFLYR